MVWLPVFSRLALPHAFPRDKPRQAGEVGEVYPTPSLSLGPLTQGMGGEGLFKPWLCCFLLLDSDKSHHILQLRSWNQLK